MPTPISTISAATPIPGAPQHVADALHTLVTELTQQLGADFTGLVLYGGLARGRFVAARSDVNVVLLLKQCDAATLLKIAPAVRDARRAAAVEPMLLAPHEVALAALDFPTKFLDIQQHHLVLHGVSPFTALTIPPAVVQRRVAQSLRNLVMRLRQRFLTHFEDAASLHTALAQSARPLAIELAALLQVSGHTVPADDRTAALYSAATQALALDGATLAELAALRDGRAPADTAALFERVLALLAALADRTDAMAGAA